MESANTSFKWVNYANRSQPSITRRSSWKANFPADFSMTILTSKRSQILPWRTKFNWQKSSELPDRFSLKTFASKWIGKHLLRLQTELILATTENGVTCFLAFLFLHCGTLKTSHHNFYYRKYRSLLHQKFAQHWTASQSCVVQWVWWTDSTANFCCAQQNVLACPNFSC